MATNRNTLGVLPVTGESVAASPTEAAGTKPVKKSPKSTPRKYESGDMIRVRSMVSGELVYKSSVASGGTYIWGDVGEACEIPYSELMVMRNSQRAFFEKNWITMDFAVLKQLGVAEHYDTCVDFDNVDAVFGYDSERIKKSISVMSAEMKGAVTVRAKALIGAGKLDSISKIRALEQALNTNLL